MLNINKINRNTLEYAKEINIILGLKSFTIGIIKFLQIKYIVIANYLFLDSSNVIFLYFFHLYFILNMGKSYILNIFKRLQCFLIYMKIKRIQI